MGPPARLELRVPGHVREVAVPFWTFSKGAEPTHWGRSFVSRGSRWSPAVPEPVVPSGSWTVMPTRLPLRPAVRVGDDPGDDGHLAAGD